MHMNLVDMERILAYNYVIHPARLCYRIIFLADAASLQLSLAFVTLSGAHTPPAH